MEEKLENEVASSRITSNDDILCLDTGFQELVKRSNGLSERNWEMGVWDET